MDKPLLIFGTGLLAEQIHFYFTEEGKRRVEAFTVDAEYLRDERFLGLPVLAFNEATERFRPESHDLFIAIGHTATAARKSKFLAALALGYTLPSFVHPTAFVASNVAIGPNSLIREQATVGPFARIGHNLMLGSQAIVSHHARVGDHCFVAPGAVLCGDSEVEALCFIGAHATVRDRVRVGEGCVIGAGAVIMADCPPWGEYRAARTPRSRSLRPAA
jgi:sugar O-acyltransferase (sialic acid O-acetyltransferase NeuD family)